MPSVKDLFTFYQWCMWISWSAPEFQPYLDFLEWMRVYYMTHKYNARRRLYGVRDDLRTDGKDHLLAQADAMWRRYQVWRDWQG